MKIMFISDTHNKHHLFNMNKKEYKNIDMIIHSGDFSHSKKEGENFMIWYSELPFKYKILIPGNHELYIEKNEEEFKRLSKELGIISLIDEAIEINNIKIYGSPWTPQFFDWAYMKEDYLLEDIWNKIPLDTQILITHGPQYGILDGIIQYGCGYNVGSETLADRIEELKKLKIHTFGHIHEASGAYKENGILRINASSVNSKYELREPFVFEFNNV